MLLLYIQHRTLFVLASSSSAGGCFIYFGHKGMSLCRNHRCCFLLSTHAALSVLASRSGTGGFRHHVLCISMFISWIQTVRTSFSPQMLQVSTASPFWPAGGLCNGLPYSLMYVGSCFLETNFQSSSCIDHHVIGLAFGQPRSGVPMMRCLLPAGIKNVEMLQIIQIFPFCQEVIFTVFAWPQAESLSFIRLNTQFCIFLCKLLFEKHLLLEEEGFPRRYREHRSLRSIWHLRLPEYMRSGSYCLNSGYPPILFCCHSLRNLSLGSICINQI